MHFCMTVLYVAGNGLSIMIWFTISGLLYLSLTEIGASNIKRGVPEFSFGSTQPDSDSDPEARSKCLAYGFKCHREGENDRCCLPNGGMCHLNTDGVRVCTPPKKPTTLEILIEDKLMRLGFSGAMIFDKHDLKIRAVRGAAHFIRTKELTAMTELLVIEKIDTVINSKFTAGDFNFAVVGTQKVMSKEGAYVSTAIQGTHDDREHNHGIYLRATPKVVMLGMHEEKEIYLGLAIYFMEDVYDDIVELEKNGPLPETRSAPMKEVAPLGQIGPLEEDAASSDLDESPLEAEA